MNLFKMIYRNILILSVYLMIVFSASAQNLSLADEYYSSNIEVQAPGAQLPSDQYYKKNLRAGWDDDDPGGSGEGGNEGVGVPIGNGGFVLIWAVGIYGTVLFIRKKRHREIQ